MYILSLLVHWARTYIGQPFSLIRRAGLVCFGLAAVDRGCLMRCRWGLAFTFHSWDRCSLNLMEPSTFFLTLSGGASVIAWCMRCPSLGECRRGSRPFWNCRASVGYGPVHSVQGNHDFMCTFYIYFFETTISSPLRLNGESVRARRGSPSLDLNISHKLTYF